MASNVSTLGIGMSNIYLISLLILIVDKISRLIFVSCLGLCLVYFREDVANHYVKSSDPSDIKRSTREILEHYDKFYLHGSVGRVTVDCLKRPRDRDHTAPLSVVTDSEPNEGSCAALKSKHPTFE